MALGDPVAHVAASDFYTDITGSSGFTGTWPALVSAQALPGALAFLCVTCRAPDDTTIAPTVTLGGVTVTADQLMQQAISGDGTGQSVLYFCTIPVTGALADDTIEIEWNLFGVPLVEAIVQGAVFQNVDLATYVFADSFAQAFDDGATFVTALASDLVIGAGGFLTGTGAEVQFDLSSGAAQATMIAGGDLTYYGSTSTTRKQGFGYFPILADITNALFTEDSAYLISPGISMVLPAVPADADGFNCECDDESGYETLGQLRRRLLIRLGFAAQADNPPPGMALLLDEFLLGAQRYLYRTFKALRTERFFRWDMEAGNRFYDLPNNDDTCSKKLDPYRVTWVGIQDQNQVWTPMIEGIPPEFYTGVAFQGLPERYEIRQCIEVFPAPYAGLTLRIKGHFGLSAFVADDDVATIDSELVFLWALGNAKAHYGHPDAGNIASQANNYRRDLVTGAHLTKRYVPGTVPAPPWTRPKFLPVNP